MKRRYCSILLLLAVTGVVLEITSYFVILTFVYFDSNPISCSTSPSLSFPTIMLLWKIDTNQNLTGKTVCFTWDLKQTGHWTGKVERCNETHATFIFNTGHPKDHPMGSYIIRVIPLENILGEIL